MSEKATARVRLHLRGDAVGKREVSAMVKAILDQDGVLHTARVTALRPSALLLVAAVLLLLSPSGALAQSWELQAQGDCTYNLGNVGQLFFTVVPPKGDPGKGWLVLSIEKPDPELPYASPAFQPFGDGTPTLDGWGETLEIRTTSPTTTVFVICAHSGFATVSAKWTADGGEGAKTGVQLSALDDDEVVAAATTNFPTPAKLRRVDLHGVPQPDPSPMGEGENDRHPSMAYVDMYNLAPKLSVADVSLPVEGGELELSLRRTLTITESLEPGGGMSTTAWSWKYACETLLGPGWQVNLGARAVVYKKTSPIGTWVSATVFDERGAGQTYLLDPVLGFVPDVVHSFSNEAVRGRLEIVNDDTLVLHRQHGTKLTFVRLPSVNTVYSAVDLSKRYYRLESVVDRNGNALSFEYLPQSPDQAELLPTRIYEAAHPERELTFTYENYGPSGRGDKGWRLRTATDPLGREWTYTYTVTPSSTTPYCPLAYVQAPEVVDGETGQPKRPQTSFTYKTFALPQWSWTLGGAPIPSFNENVFTAPSTISSPRGHVTSFTYAVEDFPVAVPISTMGVAWAPRPRAATLTSADGTAVFDTLQRDHLLVHTKVTDTQGTPVEYEFASQVVPPHIRLFGVTLHSHLLPLGGSVVVDRLDRTTCASSGDLTASFQWSPDANSNLLEVVDLSGNVTTYEYDSGDANDPYNQPLDPSRAYDAFGNPRHYQAFANPAKRTIAVGALDLVSEFRYETSFNKLTEMTDPANRTFYYAVDPANGNRTAITDPLGQVTEFHYEADGFQDWSRDPDGRLTTYARAWNPSDLAAYRTITTTVVGFKHTPLDIETIAVEDVVGNARLTIDGEGFATRQTFDAMNRPTLTELPDVEDPSNPGGPLVTPTREVLYTQTSQPAVETDENGDRTIHTYDLMERRTSTRRRMVDPDADHADDIVTSVTYNAVGLPDTETDANGNVTDLEYDDFLRLVRKIFPEVTLPGGGTTRYAELYSYEGPNAGAGSFAYVGTWKPTRTINPRGFATDVCYDAAYRDISTVRRYDDGSGIDPTEPPRNSEPYATKTYDALGNVVVEGVLTVVNSHKTMRSTYTFYDRAGRATVSVQDLDDDGPGSISPGEFVDDASLFPEDSDDIVSRSFYDGAGNVVRELDPEGRQTDHVFDGAGRKTAVYFPEVEVFDPVGYTGSGTFRPETRAEYDDRGLAVRARDANRTWTQTTYDALGRQTQTILDLNGDGTFDAAFGGDDIVSEAHYDLAGNAIRAVDSLGNETETVYDRAGRAVRVIAPEVYDGLTHTMAHPVTITVYDKNGNTIETIDPLGVTTRHDFDELGRERFVTAALGTPDEVVTEMAFDANGNVEMLTLWNDAGPQTTTRDYDAYDRLVREVLPAVADGHVRRSTTDYVLDDLVLRKADPNGESVEFAYDLAARVEESYHFDESGALEETRTFTYDKVGNVTGVADGSGESAYDFDSLNRITTEMRAIAGHGYADYTVRSAYDAVGNRTRVRYPDTDRELESHFDRAGRLVEVHDSSKLVGKPTQLRWDVNGNRASTWVASGVETVYFYDALNRVERSIADGPGGFVHAVYYTYDLAGNRVTADEDHANLGHVSYTYSYDYQYRLTGEAWSGDSSGGIYYAYDAAGNRLIQDRTVDGNHEVFEYEYDDLNRLLRVNNDHFVYDLNGRMTERHPKASKATTYTWDSSDRLIAADTDEDGVADFEAVYDYRTRRLVTAEEKELTAFRYDGGNSFQELRKERIVVEFVRGTGLGGGIGSILYSDRSSSGDSVEFFTYNPVGHTVATSDLKGQTLSENRYEAFGGRLAHLGQSKNNRLANTKERSFVLGLDNHGFRYYDPVLGRYICADPAGLVDGLNVYLYVHGNPINGIDPLGLWEEEGGFLSRMWGSARAIANAMGVPLGLTEYNPELQRQFNPLLRAQAQGGWVEDATNFSFGVAVGATAVAGGAMAFQGAAVAGEAAVLAVPEVGVPTALVIGSPPVQAGAAYASGALGVAGTAYALGDGAFAVADGDWQRAGQAFAVGAGGARVLSGLSSRGGSAGSPRLRIACSQGGGGALAGGGEAPPLLSALRQAGGELSVGRGQISVQQMAALTRTTGNEFALVRYTGAANRTLIECGPIGGGVPQNARLIVHTHPGTSALSVRPSLNDRRAITAIGQRSSVIVNESGTHALRFGRTNALDNEIVELGGAP